MNRQSFATNKVAAESCRRNQLTQLSLSPFRTK